MRVSKCGNEPAVRVPDVVVWTRKLKPGNEPEIVLGGARLFRSERDASREGARARFRALRKPLPKSVRLDRHEAAARRAVVRYEHPGLRLRRG